MIYGVLCFAGSATIGILYSRALAGAVAFAMSMQILAIPLMWTAGRKSS